jgi:hypothetical protein
MNDNKTKTKAGVFVQDIFDDAQSIARRLNLSDEQTILRIAEMILQVAEQQAEGSL